ncbi:hypothetical protein ACFL0T_08150 [Candidatus Omnitrophota bacterium]
MLFLRSNMRYITFIFICSVFCLADSGCARKESPEKIAIQINTYSLGVDEFNKLFSELGVAQDTPQARDAFLENLINRKLLLQEAQREGLDRKQNFLADIENFWEQSLLKIVIDNKTKEISSKIQVRPEEIRDHCERWIRENPDKAHMKSYDNIYKDINIKLSREKQVQAINAWIDEIRANSNIEIDKKAIGIE